MTSRPPHVLTRDRLLTSAWLCARRISSRRGSLSINKRGTISIWRYNKHLSKMGLPAMERQQMFAEKTTS